MSLTKVKIYTINDFISWHGAGGLNISPKYQRNQLWNRQQQSYLIDSLLRDIPIPPIFIREYIDFQQQKTIREVVDGQQRLSAIIQFKHDEYALLPEHNEVYGGMYFSDLPEEIKYNFLYKELLIQQIITNNDAEIYEIFVRYNTNSTPLNDQELRNAKYWGDFKVYINNWGNARRKYFIDFKIFDDIEISRMADLEFLAVLYFIIENGTNNIKNETINKLYEKYITLNIFTFEKNVSKIIYIISLIEFTFDYLWWTYNLENTHQRKQAYYYLFVIFYELIVQQVDKKFEDAQQEVFNTIVKFRQPYSLEKSKNILNYWNSLNIFSKPFDYNLDTEIVAALTKNFLEEANG